MHWFQNASTRAKLLTGFGSMALLLGVLFATSYFAISTLIGSQRRVFENNFGEVVDAMSFDANEGDIRAAMLSMVNVTNRADVDRLVQEIEDYSRHANELLTRLLHQAENRPTTLAQLEAWRSIRDEYKASREKEVIPAIRAGRLDEARTLMLTVQHDRFQKMRGITTQLIDEARADSRAAVRHAEHLGRVLLAVAAAVGIVSLVVGLTMVAYLTRLIARPLSRLLGWTQKLAEGDLRMDIPTSARADEVGVLQEGFRGMLQNLRTVNSEIQQGVNVLASSASQILTATSEMAATATETATASTQTTATVEEVKQTAQVSRAKSRQVAEIAQRAARDSESGRNAVDQSLEGMNHVRTQMEAVAESILRLSEQTQAIGEIITSVNDLAEQSNLLAVNAAIEAARAGEQGKGFAVVAHEIRNLAAQSKQATAQVRSILGDIQRATASAVTAGEESSKAVENGVRQASQAGEAIRALAESINEAAEAAQQISASSEQ